MVIKGFLFYASTIIRIGIACGIEQGAFPSIPIPMGFPDMGRLNGTPSNPGLA
jgi:hypothetical protein